MGTDVHEYSCYFFSRILTSLGRGVRFTFLLSISYPYQNHTLYLVLGCVVCGGHRTFCISVAGFKPFGEFSDAIFLPNYSTPTVHVLGKTDVIVVEERARTLIDVSANARVEYHDGGKCIYQSHPFSSLFPFPFPPPPRMFLVINSPTLDPLHSVTAFPYPLLLCMLAEPARGSSGNCTTSPTHSTL